MISCCLIVQQQYNSYKPPPTQLIYVDQQYALPVDQLSPLEIELKAEIVKPPEYLTPLPVSSGTTDISEVGPFY